MDSRNPVNRILAPVNHSQLFATPSKTKETRLGLLGRKGFERPDGVNEMNYIGHIAF